MKPDFKIVGHRGFKSKYPENTIVSFLAAMDFGVDSIEFDVRLTKDRQLVVTHDNTVDRCSNGKGLVCDFLFEDIRKLDFGSWKDSKFAGTQIPTLEETLEAILSKDPNFPLLVELKEDDDECTKRVYEMCLKYNVLEHGLMLSFHPRQLQLLRSWKPDIYLQGFPDRYIKVPQPPEAFNGLYNKTCLWTTDAKPEEIKFYHDKGVAVDLCPVDNEEQLEIAIPLDVDSITTNAPDVIYPLLRQRGLR